jgi:GNAT superfamily N-acetyltransferase
VPQISGRYHATYEPQAESRRLTVAVREGQADDIHDLARIELTFGLRTAQEWLKRIDTVAADRRCLLLVAHVDGSLAGTSEVTWLDTDPETCAPAGYLLAGVNVLAEWRRGGVARALTVPRLDWIRERADVAWYVASSANPTTIAMHDEFGFVETMRAPRIHGIDFDSGEGVLFRADLR